MGVYDMYAVSAADFMSKDMAEILIDKYVPLQGIYCSQPAVRKRPSFLPEALARCFKLRGMRKIAITSCTPNGNGDAKLVNRTVAHMLTGTQRLTDWVVHLLHV